LLEILLNLKDLIEASKIEALCQIRMDVAEDDTGLERKCPLIELQELANGISAEVTHVSEVHDDEPRTSFVPDLVEGFAEKIDAIEFFEFRPIHRHDGDAVLLSDADHLF